LDRKSDGVKVGIALGGGGARGLAHIGVLHVLEDSGIPIDMIAGTSIGALIGGLYAVDPNAEHLLQKARQYLASLEFSEWVERIVRIYPKYDSERLLDKFSNYAKQIFLAGKTMTHTSLFDYDLLETVVKDLVKDVPIERCQLPFGAVATDIEQGESVVLISGSLRKAIVASASIPGIFPPFGYQDRLLIDGGTVSMVPMREAKLLGAQFVIAVEVGRSIDRSSILNSGLDIVIRADDITNHLLQQVQLREADVVISPDVGQFRWSEFEKAEEIMEAGRTAARQEVERIKDALKREQRKRFYRRWNPFLKTANRTAGLI
jgi:NTE family protein